MGAATRCVAQVGWVEYFFYAPPSGVRLVRASEGGAFALGGAMGVGGGSPGVRTCSARCARVPTQNWRTYEFLKYTRSKYTRLPCSQVVITHISLKSIGPSIALHSIEQRVHARKSFARFLVPLGPRTPASSTPSAGCGWNRAGVGWRGSQGGAGGLPVHHLPPTRPTAL